jgi:hypothetical protein
MVPENFPGNTFWYSVDVMADLSVFPIEIVPNPA